MKLSLRTLILCSCTMLILSGCIGAFEEQPKRYNYVAGAKRAPLMNPGGQGEQVAQDQMNAAQQATDNATLQRAQDMTQMDGVPEPFIPPMDVSQQPLAPSPLASASAQEGSSPLYYYEQQAQIAMDSTPQADMQAEIIAEEPIMYEEVLIDDVPNIDMVIVPEATDVDVTVIEAPIVQPAEIIPEPQFEEIDVVDMPQTMPRDGIASVPQNDAELQRYFDEARADAESFDREVINDDVIDIDMIAGENFAPQPQQEMIAQPDLALQKPSSDTQPVMTQQVVPDKAIYEPPYQQAPIAQPMPVIDENYAEPVYQEAPTVYNPAENTVAVSDAPIVADIRLDELGVPQEQEIYTSGGPIRLTPPAPIGAERRVLGQSRYSERRRNYSRGNVYRH